MRNQRSFSLEFKRRLAEELPQWLQQQSKRIEAYLKGKTVTGTIYVRGKIVKVLVE